MVNLTATVTADRPTPVVTGATGYGVRRREFIDAPTPNYSQDELRDRRRKHLPIQLDAAFDLGEELRAVLGAAEAKLATEPCPGTPGYIESVTAISGAVEELCDRARNLVHAAKVSRVRDTDRPRARAALKALAAKPAPEITRAALIECRWAQPLTNLAASISGPLSDLLGRQSDSRRGLASVSDELIDALRSLDRTVLDLHRRIDRARSYRAQNMHAAAAANPNADAEAARATLAELGIGVDQENI
ncbi:hypothetical protein [Gordonia sp. i37]|uniref:hypothetical protein n=1 Tax=Gordonia sp. i37 TaxID=1961707 RepID=UPI0009AC9D52|nr:hypothetical protein [Gordonia sp. i37]OPX14315.1 hypothetical protein B1964_15720 [Gordonia sp. i37]